MEKFSEFITEAKEEPYNLVLLTHSAAGIRDTKDEPTQSGTEIIQSKAKSMGIKVFVGDFVGAYTKKSGNKRLIYSFPFDEEDKVILPDPKKDKVEYQKPIECNSADTIIMPRGLGTLGFTSSRHWYDMIKEFEMEGYTIINPLECYDICTSKWLSYLYFLHNNIRTPKTTTIFHSETVEQSFKELKTNFPIVLKSSTGTQTGVGVVVVESLRSLLAMVQMILLYNKHLPIIIQEYIKTDFDIRVVVCEGEIIGAMKRKVIVGDIRSNISLGAVAEEIELTELEISESLKIAEITKSKLVGVDLIPSKNREKEKPYCLEVNASLGLSGLEDVLGGSPTSKILNIYKNRDNWT